MKKIIFLVFAVLILSGCTANYEITIKNNKVKEKLKVVETDTALFDKKNDSGWTMRESFQALISGDEFSKKDYTVKSIDNTDELGINYSASLNSVMNSSLINQCYRNASVTVEGDIVTIDTGTEFECFDFYENLESIKVVFKTNHKVISTNADTKENDSYIWNITEDGNKQIIISYDKSVTKVSSAVYGVIIGIVIALFGLGYFAYKKLKNKNSF